MQWIIRTPSEQPGYQGGVAPEAKEEAFQDDLPTATDTTYETFQLPSVRGTILETEDALRQADEALRDFNAAAASPLPTGQVQEAIRDLEEAAAMQEFQAASDTPTSTADDPPSTATGDFSVAVRIHVTGVMYSTLELVISNCQLG